MQAIHIINTFRFLIVTKEICVKVVNRSYDLIIAASRHPLALAAVKAMNACRVAVRRGGGDDGAAMAAAAGGPSAERHAATLQGPPVMLRLTHCAAPRRATLPHVTYGSTLAVSYQEPLMLIISIQSLIK